MKARNHCYESRKIALKAREEYTNSIKDAEKAVVNWLVANKKKTENGDDHDDGIPIASVVDDDFPFERTLKRFGSNNPKATKHLVKCLKSVQNYEQKYTTSVEEENKSVNRAQEVQLETLKSCQEIELARIKLLLDDFSKPLCDIKAQSTQDVQITPQHAAASSSGSFNSADDEFNVLASEIEKRGKDLIANLFNKQQQNNIPYEEGMGVMDAETVGLSNELGELRDKLKSKIAIGETISKTFQILGNFLEEISVAASRMAKGLNQAQYIPSATGSLESIMVKHIGPRTGQLLNEILGIFDAEANLYRRLSESFQTELNGEYQARLGLASGNEFKLESDTDDNNWKTLCDAARTELRAESKYKQTQQKQEKARERINSGDDTEIMATSEGGETALSADDRPSLKNLLPMNGQAIKKLHEKGRRMIAMKNLNEADQRIDKEREMYEVAVAAKVKASIEYKAVTEGRLTKLESMIVDGWAGIDTFVGFILQQVEIVREFRGKRLDNPLTLDDSTHDGLIKEVRDWVDSSRKTIEKIFRRGESEISSSSAFDGFQLKIVLLDSASIYQILALHGTEDSIPAFDIDVTTIENTERQRIADAATLPVMEMPPVPPDEVMKKMENVLSKPIRSTSIRKLYEQVRKQRMFSIA